MFPQFSVSLSRNGIYQNIVFKENIICTIHFINALITKPYRTSQTKSSNYTVNHRFNSTV